SAERPRRGLVFTTRAGPAVSRTGVAESVPRATPEVEERVENAEPADPGPAGTLVRHRLVDAYLEPDAALRIDRLRLVLLAARARDVDVAADCRDQLSDPLVGREVRGRVARAVEPALVAQVLRHRREHADGRL